MAVSVEWSVVCSSPLHSVFIVGDHPKLGAWSVDRGLPLTRSNKGNDGSSIWMTTVDFADLGTVKYRYFLGQVIKDQETDQLPRNDEKKHVIVKSWECLTEPREVILPPSGGGTVKISDIYGQIGGENSACRSGFLTTQTELRLTVTVEESCRVKCDARNLSEEFADSVGTSELEVFQYVDLSTEDACYRDQPDNGVPVIGRTSYVVFRGQTVHPEVMGIRLTFYDHDPNAGPGEGHRVQGHADLMPSVFIKDTAGTLNVQIKKPDGQLLRPETVQYLLIRPVTSFQNKLEEPYQAWDQSRAPMDTGHRGSGGCRSRAVAPYILENTVKSFNAAAKHGADYVEFDVQLTKDKIPVVFHDFLCRLPPQTNEITTNGNCSFKDVFVHDCTYKELIELKAGFAVETGTKETVLVDISEPLEEDEHLFPTLTEVFEKVHPSVGFNVEIKFPAKLESGQMEDGVNSFMDANDYLDILLGNIFQKAGNRRVFLSCFCPDICVMLNLKQNRYPVQFLEQSMVPQYEPFSDLRARDIPTALRFAACEGFMGVNLISDYLKTDFSLVKSAANLGLVLMSWGSENNDSAFIEQQKKNRVQNVLYDRLMDFINKDKARADHNDFQAVA